MSEKQQGNRHERIHTGFSYYDGHQIRDQDLLDRGDRICRSPRDSDGPDRSRADHGPRRRGDHVKEPEPAKGTFHGDESILSQEVSGVVIDSRKVQPGYLFVAIDGERVNAHKFIPDTVKAGAMCVVSHEDLGETDFPYILVESTGQALLDIAKLYRDSFDMKVVGITGSVGKTSTKEMIASVLAQKYHVHKTLGNFNNEWGLPITIFDIRKDTHEYVQTFKREEEERDILGELGGWLVYILLIIGLTYLIITFVGQRTMVSGSSMETTLQDGDNLIVDKISYRFRDPKRYDIIVFPYKYEEDTYYIKRIIGMPGETVQIRDGYVYIDGKRLTSDVYGKEKIKDPQTGGRTGYAASDIVLQLPKIELLAIRN